MKYNIIDFPDTKGMKVGNLFNYGNFPKLKYIHRYCRL